MSHIRMLALLREESAAAVAADSARRNTCENEPISNTGNSNKLSPQQGNQINSKESFQW